MTYIKKENGWRKKAFNFIGSQCLNQFGTSLIDYATIWYITLQTKSAILMSVAMICVFVPKIIISFVAGVWADNYNRKLLVVLSDSFCSVVTICFGILFFLGYNDIWLIFLILSLRSIAIGVRLPSTKAIIPLLVPSDKLVKVNGINSSIESTIAILSPAAGGAILTYYTLDLIAYVDVLFSIISIIILLRINIPYNHKENKKVRISYFSNFSDSYRYLLKNTVAKNYMLLYLTIFFLAVPMSLLVPVKIARLFEEVWRLSFNEILFSVGCILGGVVIAAIRTKINHFKLVCLSFLLIGFSCFFLSFSNYLVILIAMTIIGFFISVSNSITMGLFQKHVETKYMGRIFSMIQILSSIANLLGLIIFGFLGDTISVDSILVTTSIIFVAYTIFAYKKSSLRYD